MEVKENDAIFLEVFPSSNMFLKQAVQGPISTGLSRPYWLANICSDTYESVFKSFAFNIFGFYHTALNLPSYNHKTYGVQQIQGLGMKVCECNDIILRAYCHQVLRHSPVQSSEAYLQ